MCRQLAGVVSLYVGWGFVCGWVLSLGGGSLLLSFENFVRLKIMDVYLANGVRNALMLY